MVARTLILRPSADKSCQHKASSGSACFAMLRESPADDDSTYIYQKIDSTAEQTAASTITLSGKALLGKVTVKSVTLFHRARISRNGEIAECKCTFSVPGGPTLGITTGNLSSGYSNASVKNITMVDALNQHIAQGGELPTELECVISTKGYKESSKSTNGYIRITQIYAMIDYEVEVRDTFYLFIGGAWKKLSGTTVWKKQNGIWVQEDSKKLFKPGVKYRKGN